jgi:hypothetical protein
MSTYSNIPAQQGSKNAAISMVSTDSLKLGATTLSEAGRVQQSTYIYEGAAADSNTTVTVRRESTKEGGRRISVRLLTTVISDVADTEADRIDVYDATLSWNIPTAFVEDPADQSVFLQVLVGLVLGGFDGTTGAPAAGVVAALNFGRTQVW